MVSGFLVQIMVKVYSGVANGSKCPPILCGRGFQGVVVPVRLILWCADCDFVDAVKAVIGRRCYITSGASRRSSERCRRSYFNNAVVCHSQIARIERRCNEDMMDRVDGGSNTP